MQQDSYQTINIASPEVLYKDKNSKFFGYAFPVINEEQVKEHLEQLKKQHYAARHFCYAYQMGEENFIYRANDDGEPNNSAGIPIYNQLLSYNVTNILVVVVRYFGGTKLGVSGLISAYKATAQMTLEAADIVKQTINKNFILLFSYANLNKVMRIIKEQNYSIVSQEMGLDAQIEISVRKSLANNVQQVFKDLYEVTVIEK